jgi:AraC-like DNA-binding protein
VSVSTGEESFDLSARPIVKGAADFVLTRAAQAATVGEAMREIALAYNLLHGGQYNRVETRGQTIAYVLDDERFPYTRPRDDYLTFSLECALIFVHAAVCELADEDLTAQVRKVVTRRGGGVHGTRAALAFWQAPVRSGAQVYGLIYDAEIATRPVSRRPRHMRTDVAVHNRLLTLVEARQAQASAADPVSAAVVKALKDGLHDQSAIAERLGMSTATLRRRLTALGLSFRALYQGVLMEEALTKLAATGDVGQTAEVLGFSDPRSFTRAFKAWTGETPSGYVGRSRRAAG